MGNKPRKVVINWDNEPEKKIADRLAALYLYTEYSYRQGAVSSGFREGVSRILTTDDPKGVKYTYAELMGIIFPEERP